MVCNQREQTQNKYYTNKCLQTTYRVNMMDKVRRTSGVLRNTIERDD